MSDCVQLIGAEQVQTAANTMREAAQEISRAAGALEWTLQQHQQRMVEWLDRFEAILERAKP